MQSYQSSSEFTLGHTTIAPAKESNIVKTKAIFQGNIALRNASEIKRAITNAWNKFINAFAIKRLREFVQNSFSSIELTLTWVKNIVKINLSRLVKLGAEVGFSRTTKSLPGIAGLGSVVAQAVGAVVPQEATVHQRVILLVFDPITFAVLGLNGFTPSLIAAESTVAAVKIGVAIKVATFLRLTASGWMVVVGVIFVLLNFRKAKDLLHNWLVTVSLSKASTKYTKSKTGVLILLALMIVGSGCDKGKEQTIANSQSPSINNIDQIEGRLRQKLLYFGYPEEKIPEILKEFRVLFSEIGSANLQELSLSKDAQQLKVAMCRLMPILEAKGYRNYLQPRRIIRLLTSYLTTEDVSELINQAKISEQVKVDQKEGLAGCSAISQLAYLLLDAARINVKAVTAPRHSFTLISLSGNQVLFVDFNLGIVQEIDLSKYYQKEGEYLVLKLEYRIAPEILLQFKEKLDKGSLALDKLKKEELLHLFYFYIRITNDGYGFTPFLRNNLGVTYSKLVRVEEAVQAYQKAIMTPNSIIILDQLILN